MDDDQNKQNTIDRGTMDSGSGESAVTNGDEQTVITEQPQPEAQEPSAEDQDGDQNLETPELPEPEKPEELPAPESNEIATSRAPRNDDSEKPEESDEPAEETKPADEIPAEPAEESSVRQPVIASTNDPNAKWYVIHTFAGHENKVLTTLKQRVEAEHLENKIFDILVPTQDKIEIRAGKKETVKEKIFPGYILVKMILDDNTWLTVRTTQGVTSFIGAGNKPIPISEAEVSSIVKFTTQGAAPTFKDVFMVDDTVKIVDGPFSDFIGKVDSVDKEKGRVRVLVSIFGRETPVELDFLQIQKL